MYHRYHRKNQNSIPAESIDGIGDLHRKIASYQRRHDEKHQQKAGYDEARKPEGYEKSLYALSQRRLVLGQVYIIIILFFHDLSSLTLPG